jgi:O-antigen ligase
LRVTLAYPWFGVGIGNQAYLNLSEPLRVAAQTKPLQEPDNTYLQWGATSGIPIMLLFLTLLGSVFVTAWRNWLKVDVRYRVLFAAGIASLLALSINSLTADGWTSPIDMPFLGWLIAGIVTSPLLRRRQSQQSHLTHPATALVEAGKGEVGNPEIEGNTLERRSKAESVV